MKNKKGLIFIGVAILSGILAFIGVYGLITKMSPSVPALEANVDIAAGTPLDRSYFSEVRIPESGMPTEIISPGDIDFSTAIAAKDISAGDLLRKPAILSLDDPNPSLYSARLKSLKRPDLRGVEVPVESIKGILYGMNTQDHVDLVSVYNRTLLADSNGTQEKIVEEMTAETIIKGAPVIGVKDKDKENTVLIIAVTEEEAEIIALHREIGKIYATLRPFGEGL